MHKRFMGVVLFVLGVLATVVFQQVGQTAPALTALDYAEIDQLYARYAVTFDIGNNDLFRQTFTEDGVFVTTNPDSGDPVPIEVWAAEPPEEPNAVRTPLHYTTNILIKPTAEGATGVAYLRGGRTGRTGVYYDQLVKTPEGWRFKKRTFTWERFGDELLQAFGR